MTKPIRRVAVLGAGVMGSGIAAHCANAKIPVLLLDIVPPSLSDPASRTKAERDGFAAGALKKMRKHRPAPLTHKRNLELIEVGNFDDDLQRLSEVDLVIEAVIEKLSIKRSLFEKLEAITAGTDTLIASNTSGLRIVDMLEGRSEDFRQRFLITHFFNPPRYMKLLELVVGPDTSAEHIDRIEDFGREVLGKGIVYAKDVPNFVANRIGCHSLMNTIHLMLEMGLNPEDVDAITGVPMGHPKSATFRTSDVVGLDTLVHVVDNCYNVLTEDPDREVFAIPEYIRTMVANKQLGSKTKAGFYKKTKEGIVTLDPKSGEYRPRQSDKAIKGACKSLAGIGDPAERIKKLVATEGVVGEFAWKALAKPLVYAASLIGEICDDVRAVDEGMRWGYNWELGPFETWDALGFAETCERLEKEGHNLPQSIQKMRTAGASGFYQKEQEYDLINSDYKTRKRDPREQTLASVRQGSSPLYSNDSAEAWDLGDGIVGVCFKSKANSIDGDNMKVLNDAIDRAEQDFAGVLLFNEGDFFCVGANLMLVAMAASSGQFQQIEELVKGFQDTCQRMKYAQVPVLSAPFNMTLGGGLELCLGSDAVQAACETYAGLVEVGVGIIPGGGGTLNLLWRALDGIIEGAEVDTYPLVTQVFKNIATAKVATSAEEAKALGFFQAGDGVTFDRARHLHDAKKRLVGLSAGYRPPTPRAYKLPGESGIATLSMFLDTMVAAGHASEHDALIGRKLATVLCGGVAGAAGPVTEQHVLDLEREAFVSLCGEAKTQARIQHFLMSNKPLRN
jgi:3-hydroxyacyl-CoA dehydrogenase